MTRNSSRIHSITARAINTTGIYRKATHALWQSADKIISARFPEIDKPTKDELLYNLSLCRERREAWQKYETEVAQRSIDLTGLIPIAIPAVIFSLLGVALHRVFAGRRRPPPAPQA